MSCLSVVVGVGDGWRLEPCRASEVTKGLKMWAAAASWSGLSYLEWGILQLRAHLGDSELLVIKVGEQKLRSKCRVHPSVRGMRADYHSIQDPDGPAI
jgi:hypothetical protein